MITSSEARRIFNYDPETGLLSWAVLAGNGSSVGEEAGHLNGRYRAVRVNGRAYMTHRIIWLIINGLWPDGEIDHINGDGRDNRISNLRDVTHRENQCNQACHREGNLPGASFHKKSLLWQARIRINGGRVWLGLHESEEAAHKVYIAEKTKIEAQA